MNRKPLAPNKQVASARLSGPQFTPKIPKNNEKPSVHVYYSRGKGKSSVTGGPTTYSGRAMKGL